MDLKKHIILWYCPHTSNHLFFFEKASYTIFCVAKLLNLLTPTLASDMTLQFIASCQTYEGGFGGEPFTEAHGGYAYCAVSALQLLNRLEDDDTIDRRSLLGWLVRRQMGYEGGFSGRANKLVDGCYSFWQGGALTIISAHFNNNNNNKDTTPNDDDDNNNNKGTWPHGERGDIWLPTSSEEASPHRPASYALLFDKPMLERYILLCAQDVNGGLRDKPSKPRDFYHSCYNLSGLSLAQHMDLPQDKSEQNYNQHNFGHPIHSKVAASHPCYNIRLERVPIVLDHFMD
jgi:protein farnesyltransferase subunit beta